MTGRELKAWRERNELSQVAAAEALGWSRRAIQKYEASGNKVPDYIQFACSWLEERRPWLLTEARGIKIEPADA